MKDSQELKQEEGLTRENEMQDAESPVVPEESKTENVEGNVEEAIATPEVTPEQEFAPIVMDAREPEPIPVVQKEYKSKTEILDRVKEIAHSSGPLDKAEIDHLKTSFYRILNAERAAETKDYIDKGGDPNAYTFLPDDTEESFKAEMKIIKERRAKLFREQEAEKEANLKRKLEIIEKIKGMATSPEEANKAYQEFKKLQQEWREIKSVPAAKANELWRNYQLYVENFYDLLKLNSEAREYDFRKNLELKTKLCEAAEKLADEPDVISAFHQLQKLHQEFREIGPVSKNLREEVWTRFKTASTVINKRHQQHFEEIKAKEEENLVKKTALCEKVENIVAADNKGTGDWEKHTKEIIAIQAEWKTIGFAPQKMNVEIFKRFRAACDIFFSRKAEYFKALKAQFKENADKKRALIEKAKAMKDSTEWKSTTDKFIALQKEWRTVGPVPKKLGDQLWEEFLSTCNAFFEARNAATGGERSNEHANLEKKRELIAQLKQIAEGDGENAQQEAQEIADEYNAVGHVPFKEKDVVYEEFHAALDELKNKFGIIVNRRRSGGQRTRTYTQSEQNGGTFADGERLKLLHQYDSLKSELQTYENNIGFLSASSKKGSNILDEMNKKVQKLRDKLEAVRDKINALENGSSTK